LRIVQQRLPTGNFRCQRGIGYATAELFTAHGAKLVLVDLVMDEQIANEIALSIVEQTG
jgi:NAD(P)-dependent dehydrogenase (short-subunit alcohol dehydrogenase family)